MSRKRVVVMISILFITILTASGFYVLTGEAEIGKFLNVNSIKSGDWEKVYVKDGEEAPYTETSKAHNGEKYYIRYTGEKSGRTIVDLDETGYGLTKGADGYPYIFKQKITNTYKMFSNNDDLYRVFIPASIAFAEDDASLTTKYKGIQTNTFDKDDQVIDCVYRTPNLGSNINERGTGLTAAYDKTGISYINASNITTYVSLDANNINRTSGSYANTYNGSIANVYVDSSVKNILVLFAYRTSTTNFSTSYNQLDSKEINKVLLDESGDWKNVNFLFLGQTFTELSEHFQLPNSVINMPGVFCGCTKLGKIPNNFKIPEKAEDLLNLFCDCHSLEKLPDALINSIKNSTNIVTLEGTFARMYNLSATITIPSQVSNVTSIFLDSGNSNLEIGDTHCPIVMKYSDTNIPSLTYRQNIKGLTAGGKVYKQLYDWEVIQDNNGPYTDSTSGIKYYLHYRGKGKDAIVDLGVAKDQLTITGTTKVNSGITKIFGTEVTNTYRMFAKTTEYDENDKAIYTNDGLLYRVIIPSSIAFNSSGGIQTNTFDGDSQVIDCIYRTPNLGGAINERGTGLTSTYDKTGISYINAPNVTTYVSLDSNNIKRESGSMSNAYKGTISNVYVDSSVKNINSLFAYRSSSGGFNISVIQLDSTKIDNVLLDESGTWTNLNAFVYGQTFKELPEHFQIPNSATSVSGTFNGCTELTKLPTTLTVPNKIIDMAHMFCDCWALESLPDSLTNSIKNCTQLQTMQGTFARANKLSATITIPSSVVYLVNIFMGTGSGSSVTIGNTGCPVVMNYSDTNIPSLTYRENIKGLVASGKVYKQLYNWEAIQNNDGPYTDRASGIKYYLHYRGKGKDAIVDLGVAKDRLTITGTTKVNSGITKIFGTEVTSTYRMFAKTTEYDENDKAIYTNDGLLYRVIIPSSIAFNTNGGIQTNTFDGDSQVIDCIYRTPNLGSSINERGTGLTSTYDKTGIITQSNITTYVSLDSNNINRTSGSYANTYKGSVTNVYVDSSLKDVSMLFTYRTSTTGFNVSYNQLDSTKIDNVLLDESGTWTNLNYIFGGQTFKELPEHFQIPNSATSVSGTFNGCTELTKLPTALTVPNKITDMAHMFCDCWALESLPDSLTNSIKNCTQLQTMQGTFARAYKLSATITISANTGMVNTFVGTGSSAKTKITASNGKQYSIIVNCKSQAVYNAITEIDGVLHKVLDTSIQSLDDSSQAVVVSDDVRDTSSNSSSSSDKIVIEDETDWITVTVNKKTVDEVVDETQETSQSVESVEENNDDGEEVQE